MYTPQYRTTTFKYVIHEQAGKMEKSLDSNARVCQTLCNHVHISLYNGSVAALVFVYATGNICF